LNFDLGVVSCGCHGHWTDFTGDVSIAVVVQRLVPAEAAGVMFTMDPVSGALDRVVVSANWGLGESVVAGDVTPDVAVVDRASGALVSYQLGGKEVMTVADGAGTLETETPADLRSTPVLSPAQAGELARVGLAIETLFGVPVDVEWARADGELWAVQARPITAVAARPADPADPAAGEAALARRDRGPRTRHPRRRRGNATMLLHSGDRVRVDGGSGTVEILERA
jgi:rifampicin phosphotransferase